MDRIKLEGQQVPIELKEDVALGIYANFAIVAHSNTEFVIDFVCAMPGMQKAIIQSRIILAPERAKRLLRELEGNVRMHEEVFGRIRLGEEGNFTSTLKAKGEA